MSNSLLEYGLAGIPAVSFAVGGNAEVISEGRTGFLVPPGDTDAMAQGVVRLLGDDELHQQMSRAARDQCEATFSPDRVRDLTLDFFASLID